ncbi:hypothetical protein [Pantoea sp. paga]|uniref:hypothetical protein n=1 Tax=Pantoea sp. paga TaxID=2597519 RepID=UPI00118079DA|nr:hypothetical protein [Pantoea sp. paga]TSH77919.1 hypothetical protein FOV68_23565 [Pantoea sp. paga]
MARERYTHQNGEFFAPDGSPVNLGDIPQNASVAFAKPDGTTEYLIAWHVQQPSILLDMAQGKYRGSEPHPDDEAVSQHYRDLHAFLTDVLGSHHHA